MKTVRIIKNYDWPHLLRQTPGQKGEWDGILFTLDPVDECDYAIIINHVPENTEVVCPPNHVWAIMQEDAIPAVRRQLNRDCYNFYRVYTADDNLVGEKYIHTHGSQPWAVDKDYDALKSCQIPVKTRVLSWITSNRTYYRGHKERMDFLRKIRGHIEFDLFGRGFTPIDDKWDGLAPYNYSLVVENFHGPFGWSEKLADCYLSWTMPIYYGCTNIEDYFPEESFVRIDIKRQEAIREIRDVINSDLWLQNREAIAYARELVLEKHQFFPFFTAQIHQFEAEKKSNLSRQKERIFLRAQRELKPSFWGRASSYLYRFLKLR